MKHWHVHPPSLLAGAALAALALLATGQNAVSEPQRWSHRIVDDVDATGLKQLSEEGWEFVGYLGEGKRGTGNDETLWRKAAK